MAKLINGNGNPAIYASQDADLIASLSGNTTSIAAVGNEFTATQEDANTIGLADGVIITQEGRRIQLDDGDTDLFTIPTGTAGTTSYYIIGYKLSTQADSSQTCETFVQKMNSSSETITEDTFKGGATDVYVSCYRVTQDGLNIDSINLLLPKLGNISELKASLTDFSFRVNNGVAEYSVNGGITWNKLGGGGYMDAKYIIDCIGYYSSAGGIHTVIANNTTKTVQKVQGAIAAADIDSNYATLVTASSSQYSATYTLNKEAYFYPNNNPVPVILKVNTQISLGYQGNYDSGTLAFID